LVRSNILNVSSDQYVARSAPGLAAQLGRIGHEVFTFGFVAAMRSTMVLPIVLLAVAAASCFMITRQARPAEAAPTGVAVTEAQSGR